MKTAHNEIRSRFGHRLRYRLERQLGQRNANLIRGPRVLLIQGLIDQLYDRLAFRSMSRLNEVE